MAQWRRYPRLWLVLGLIVVLATAAALWLRGTQPGSDRSPLATPISAASGVSPLSLPTPETTAPPLSSSWTSGGAVLLWVILGILLALIIALIIIRWCRRSAL